MCYILQPLRRKGGALYWRDGGKWRACVRGGTLDGRRDGREMEGRWEGKEGVRTRGLKRGKEIDGHAASLLGGSRGHHKTGSTKFFPPSALSPRSVPVGAAPASPPQPASGEYEGHQGGGAPCCAKCVCAACVAMAA
eukprot:CAMPEP_0180051900 /NCGR_PEP_ID=MMETSP0985-20121206/1428_1 /TAXON_ID=483367 /ORGANISM="non described non described, Strain CCMP 2436" /LENGTH=136 /DNA_ID=CAMNT_0021981233 /DNA_START=413 /DNA_END=823 /DNA_ORIENTATION=-